MGLTRARIFLLSPANCAGRRARRALAPDARFALALALRSAGGASLGEVFSVFSGLYFRGKLAYARHFARPPDPADSLVAGGVLVITPSAGLRAADTRVTRESLLAFAASRIDRANPEYREPLERAARAVRTAVGSECGVVLLGSVASGKYVDLLLPIFGNQLLFPCQFVGRGDMSRGALLLRAVAAGVELDYRPLDGAVRRGPRPPRLAPLTREPR